MYFDESSTARTAVGIKPPKRALAAATPPPSNEDFISDRRLKLKCKTSFWGLRLLYLSMDLAPVRQPRCNFETGSGPSSLRENKSALLRQRRRGWQPGTPPGDRAQGHGPPRRGGGSPRPFRAHHNRMIPKPGELPWAGMRRRFQRPFAQANVGGALLAPELTFRNC